ERGSLISGPSVVGSHSPAITSNSDTGFLLECAAERLISSRPARPTAARDHPGWAALARGHRRGPPAPLPAGRRSPGGHSIPARPPGHFVFRSDAEWVCSWDLVGQLSQAPRHPAGVGGG